MIKNPVTRGELAAGCRPARSSPSPARRSRTASPSCGRSSTRSTRGCWAARNSSATATASRSSAAATVRRRRLRRLTQPFVLRRRQGRPHPRARPPGQDRAGGVGRTDPRADRALPTRRRPAPPRRIDDDRDEATGSGPRRPDPAQADLQPPRPRPRRRVAPGRPVGKLARYDELVDELLDVDERALVFTQFREMGELLRRHAAERLQLRVPFLHGGVSRARRGDGRRLPGGRRTPTAPRVAESGRHWAQPHRRRPGDPLRPVVEPGCRGPSHHRAWRIGQWRTVVVHKLVCEGTVEERIAALIDEKRALADAVVGSGEAWLSELSTDELRELVGSATSTTRWTSTARLALVRRGTAGTRRRRCCGRWRRSSPTRPGSPGPRPTRATTPWSTSRSSPGSCGPRSRRPRYEPYPTELHVNDRRSRFGQPRRADPRPSGDRGQLHVSGWRPARGRLPSTSSPPCSCSPTRSRSSSPCSRGGDREVTTRGSYSNRTWPTTSIPSRRCCGRWSVPAPPQLPPRLPVAMPAAAGDAAAVLADALAVLRAVYPALGGRRPPPGGGSGGRPRAGEAGLGAAGCGCRRSGGARGGPC